MLDVRNLSKSFGGVQATDDVSLTFDKGSLTAIIGPNGAGKTTLFNLISGKLVPDEGEIMLGETNLAGLSEREIVGLGVGRAFQIASLFPALTVRESVASAATAHRGETLRFTSRFPSRVAGEKADEILEMIGMEAQANTLSQNLNHGDQKLLDVGLALALQPTVLLLDEPTAGMGSEERWKMIEKVRDLWRRTGITVLFIEHDMDIVFEIAQRIDVLKYGRVLASGNATEIRNNPDVIEAYLGSDEEAA